MLVYIYIYIYMGGLIGKGRHKGRKRDAMFVSVEN